MYNSFGKLIHLRYSGEVTRQLLLSDLEESKREEKLKDIADSITRLRGSSSLSYLSSKVGRI